LSIEIKNLSVRYPREERWVLYDANLSIPRGEFVLMSGPSGSGKSTLAYCLMGLIPHSIRSEMQGEVIIDGLNTKEHSVGELAEHVGLVFQNPDEQIVALTVEEEVSFGPENLCLSVSEIHKRVDEAINAVGIKQLRKRNIYTLSGGQKQRTAIADILAMRPNIIVFDEPTADLDTVGRREVMQEIMKLKQEYDKTIILIEHRLEEPLKYADRVILQDIDGRIIMDNEPHGAFKNPQLFKNLGIDYPPLARIAYDLGMDFLPLSENELISRLRTRMEARQLRFTNRPIEERKEKKRPIISVENLKYSYEDGTEALRDLDISISAGEFVAIIGQNGAGKSTLAYNLVGLLKPTSGRVIVDGINTSKASIPQMAQKIGFVFQNPDHQLFTDRIWDEVAFGLKHALSLPQRELEERTQIALETMGLVSLKEKHPHAISRGQRRRLAVATVLAMKPKIILLDEPTTGQDYGHTSKLMDLVKKLNKTGKTIIMITHEIGIVAEHAERTIVMHRGKVLIDGPTRKVFANSKLLSEAGIIAPTIVRVSQNLFGGKVPIALTVEELCNML